MIALHATTAELSSTPFGTAWKESGVPAPYSHERLQTVSISTAPHGKHPLEECEAYERAWRQVASDVIAELSCHFEACLIWAYGTVERGALLDVFPYLEPLDGRSYPKTWRKSRMAHVK